MRTLAFAAVVVLTSSCDSSSPSTSCPAGEVFVDGGCRRVCHVDVACLAGEACIADVCQACANCRIVPQVDGVDGTGTADGATGHAAHHLNATASVVLVGQNLDGASVRLSGAGHPEVDLLACGEQTSTRLEVALPADVVAGSQYILTVMNQAGACTTQVTVLQGEKGAKGSVGAKGDPGEPFTDAPVVIQGAQADDQQLTLDPAWITQAGMSSFNAAALLDDYLDNVGWEANTATAGAYVEITFTAATVVTGLQLVAADVGHLGVYLVEYSDTGSTWTQAMAGVTPGVSNYWYAVGAHLHWRIRLTNTPGAGPAVSELNLFGATAGPAFRIRANGKVESKHLYITRAFTNVPAWVEIPGSDGATFCALTTVDDDEATTRCSVTRLANGTWHHRTVGTATGTACAVTCFW
ncbi:MAG: hypothetical protein HY903_07810 [Deltaproteobacteria bacterium]|nr:hypothetical protein [Deltaproteobacteria bacterium]